MQNWWLRLVLVSIAAVIIDKVADWALATFTLGPITRVSIALLPLPGNLAVIAVVLARIRRLDEFQKRIHFEAVVVAFLGTGVAVFIHDYLRRAQMAGPLQAAKVWAFMAITYAIGYVLAVRQYR